MRVPLLDLTRQHERVREAVASRVQAVFDSQQFILGQAVADFEKAFCDFTGCAHAVGMSSGTDAELAIFMAMGLGPGDAVVTTPYTFFSTAGCIHRVGAEPVFVDIDADTLLMDAEKLRRYLAEQCRRGADGSLLSARGNRIRAVIPVHLFGACCAMDALGEVASAFGLPIIEDASQAIGSEYAGKSGRAAQAGTFGDFGFFSFFPTKNLGAAGDAGMAVCRDGKSAETLRQVRNHGMTRQYLHESVGGNFRLDAIQAAVLQAKLPLVAEWNAGRRRNADFYRAELGGLSDYVQLPAEPWKADAVENHHIYHQYVIRADRRDDLLRHLAAAEIGHAVYYPVPLHLQECFAYLGHQTGDFPEAERAAKETLALPIYPELKEDEAAAVTAAIKAFYRA